MEWTRGSFTVSDDFQKVDLDTVCVLLADTYWAATRPRHAIEESIKNSIVFGMYTDEKMIGFARVTTDRAVFGWVSDVIIDPAYRGQGLGTWLMECILDHPIINKLSRLGLATKDAHGLYEKFGFDRRETMILRRD
jgi:GNAT superfamily N-acetyltransferase